MPQITIRRLPDAVHRALRAQAASEGISAEEKARRVLSQGLLPQEREGLGTRLRNAAGELGLDDEAWEVERDRSAIEPAKLE